LISAILTALELIDAPAAFSDGKTNVISFDYFSQVDGLPNNQIQCIFQDKYGWTWIGTRGGLNLLAKSKQVFQSFSALPNDNQPYMTLKRAKADQE
jgi:Two component regulator propeller.